MPRFVISAFDKLRRYSSYHERTPDRVRGRLFARWYDRPFDFVSFHKAAITQVIPPDHQQALLIDTTFIAKSGTHTYGLERFWNSRQRRSEKGLEVSAIAWLDLTDNCAYGLSKTGVRHDANPRFHEDKPALSLSGTRASRTRTAQDV